MHWILYHFLGKTMAPWEFRPASHFCQIHGLWIGDGLVSKCLGNLTCPAVQSGYQWENSFAAILDLSFVWCDHSDPGRQLAVSRWSVSNTSSCFLPSESPLAIQNCSAKPHRSSATNLASWLLIWPSPSHCFHCSVNMPNYSVHPTNSFHHRANSWLWELYTNWHLCQLVAWSRLTKVVREWRPPQVWSQQNAETSQIFPCHFSCWRLRKSFWYMDSLCCSDQAHPSRFQ